MIGLSSASWHSIQAAIGTAALLMCLPAHSEPRDEDLFLRPEDMRTVLFGSLDAGRSVFATAGVKRTLTGPHDRSGFVAMETSGLGLTHERYEPDPYIKAVRVTSETVSLLGYQWAGSGLYAALYTGPELHQEQLTTAAAAGRWSKPRIGFRGQAELWWIRPQIRCSPRPLWPARRAEASGPGPRPACGYGATSMSARS
jgi:hypothetical protein